MITKGQLATLARIEAQPVVSIYLPTHVKGRETAQDPIRLKNALTAVTARLLEAGMRRPEVEAMLAGAYDLLEDDRFWRYQAHGLAVFAAPGLFEYHKLPDRVPEIERIGPRAYLKPLLPLFADDGRFYVLTAHANDARLHLGSRHGLTELEVEMERSVAEVTAETDYENLRHAAPAARPRTVGHIGMPATHNFGDDPEEQRKTQLIEHLRRIHNALEQHLGGDRAPIVLVAQPEVEGHLRALAKGITFHEEGVQADPDSMSADELHARAYELVRPLFARDREEALDRFRALAGSGDGRGTTDLRAIVNSAYEGRVDTIFVAEDEALFGRHDPEQRTVRLEAEDTPENDDLSDYVAMHTALNGGFVQVLPRAEMPAEAPLCAILRY